MVLLNIAILSAIVIGLTEAIKRALVLPKRFIPLVAIALSIFLGGTAVFTGVSEINVWGALIAGLMSCGLWSGTKNVLNK